MTEKDKTRKICKEDMLWILKAEDIFLVLPEVYPCSTKQSGTAWESFRDN